MGLGKTIQLLSFIAERLESDPHLDPVLIVAPVSLLENWKDEIEKFFEPGAMRVLTLYGDELRSFRVPRHELEKALTEQGITRLLRKDWRGDANVVLTTYDTLRDLEFTLARQAWSIMVCDEAQRIKNPNALVTRAAKKQRVQFRIACTGTPVENSLNDLWCLFDFIQPGLLGSLQHFGRTYRRPIEAESDEQRRRVAELRELIEPQVLRRTKSEVAKELPAKVEDQACKALPMSSLQLGLYGSAVALLRERSQTDPSAQLQSLHTIRMICSDPHATLAQTASTVQTQRLIAESPKMEWLVARLEELANAPTGEKVIVFCEFRDLQVTLRRVIYERFRIDADIVNGDTTADPRHHRSRQRIIRKFQEAPGFNVIILSPQAIGFGVNIQAANHVIHFMRTWNPAKEDQATDRAYRIGQTREVTVYTPSVVAKDFKTFDQKLDELLTWKRTLAKDMLNGSGDLNAADFAALEVPQRSS
jgi:SNF2 family DNA or RNA helicase